MKNKFFTRQVCDCALLAQTLHDAQKSSAEKRIIVKQEIHVTNSEWYLMNCLWEESPRTLMQLVPLLKERVGWSKSTCATMVRRMAEKGLIGYEEKGKTKYFYAKVEKEDVVVQETRDFLQRIYDGSVGMMMSALLRQNDLSGEDIQELQEILEAAQNNCERVEAPRSSKKPR